MSTEQTFRDPAGLSVVLGRLSDSSLSSDYMPRHSYGKNSKV
jgi:hypothetical protein